MCGLTYNPLNPPTMIHAPLPKHYHHHHSHHHQRYNHYPPKPPPSPAQPTIKSTSALKPKSQANTHCLRRGSKTSLSRPITTTTAATTTATTTTTEIKTKTLLLRRKLVADLNSLPPPSTIKFFYAQPYTHVVPSKRPRCDSAKYLPSIPSSREGADEHEFRRLKRCETAGDECARAGEIVRDRRRRRRLKRRGEGGGPVTRSRARAKEMLERINTRSRTSKK